MNFVFKDKYITTKNEHIKSDYPAFYRAHLANGDGTKANPAPANSFGGTQAATKQEAIILGGGYFKMTANIHKDIDVPVHIIGQGIGSTVVDCNSDTSAYQLQFWTCYFKDITFNSATLKATSLWNKIGYKSFSMCEFKTEPVILNGNCHFVNNIFHYLPSGQASNITGRNTFINASGAPLNLQQQLYHKCKIDLSQSLISTYENNFTAFNDCEFRIGSETTYRPLIGATPEKLRENFASRCKDAGVTLTVKEDAEKVVQQDKWLFTKGCIFRNVTFQNSDIHKFEIKNDIVFGLLNDRYDIIGITKDKNRPATFTSDYGSEGLEYNENALTLKSTVDITNRQVFNSLSKVIYLGGKKELQKLLIPNSLKREYGVLLDSTLSLLVDNAIKPGEAKIEKDVIYVVRSTDKQPATVSYNAVNNYNTDTTSPTSRFRGVEGKTSFTTVSGNPVVYKLDDVLQYQTIQMRIVNELPPQDKWTTSGNLLKGYWYMVEHDNAQDNTDHFIKYDGVEYRATDSFLVNDVSVFEKVGDIHLVRCWKDNFNMETEDYDKNFWLNKQKPQWFNVLPEDPRCLMKNNSYMSGEMAGGNDYITTGNPLFYNSLQTSGYNIPAYNICGTYMQLRLVISTQNIINIA